MADVDVFSQLPLDVLFQILIKLPTISLVQLRRVSKSFNPFIVHPHFLKLRLTAATDADRRHHIIYYESTDYTKTYFSFHADASFSLCNVLKSPFQSLRGYLRVVGSDRGVVCLFDTNYFTCVGTVILWNPFIGKSKIIPFPQESNCFGSNDVSHVTVGFGFDHVNLDFKIVMILYGGDKEHEFMPKALVYSVKSGSWRNSEVAVPCFMPRNWYSSVFVNGVVHWLAYKNPKIERHPNCIMGFDVVEEVFKLMEVAQNLGPNSKELLLCCWIDEKSVALFVSHEEYLGKAWDLWLMNEYGNAESWTKTRTIVLEQVFFPLKIVNGGDILASTDDDKLVSIDVDKEKVKDLQVCGLPRSFYAATYMPSLAMIDTGDQLPALL